MKRLSLLIKPASSLCNMRCRYCFYGELSARRRVPSRGIMPPGLAARIMENVFQDLDGGDELTLVFQGGEPTLAGLGWFEDFAGLPVFRRGEVKVNYALQTNGLLLDDAWGDFLHRHRFLVGLSLDGDLRFHDRVRLTPEGRGTGEETLRRKALLEAHGVEYNVLCVLTNELAKEPDRIGRFIQREHIGYIQFIPCLEGLGDDPDPKLALAPFRFASFYSRLLQWWIRELEEGRYVSVKFFDDLANLFLKGFPSACGIDGRCRCQYVVEADGSVYPCDFYASDAYYLGNLGETTPGEILASPALRDFILQPRDLPKICGGCDFFTFCRGGCKRMERTMYFGGGGLLCGCKQFLEHNLGRLEEAVGRFFNPGSPG